MAHGNTDILGEKAPIGLGILYQMVNSKCVLTGRTAKSFLIQQGEKNNIATPYTTYCIERNVEAEGICAYDVRYNLRDETFHLDIGKGHTSFAYLLQVHRKHFGNLIIW